MQQISMLGFRDTLEYPLGPERDAVLVLAKHNTMQFIDRLRGQSTVFVVSHPMGAEAIEVYSPDGQRLVAVNRGIDDSPIMSHPAGACVEFHGLPINPCTYASAICASAQATETLRSCLATPAEE